MAVVPPPFRQKRQRLTYIESTEHLALTIFGKKWVEPVHNHGWAAVAFFTDKLNVITRYSVREIRQLDDYAWRRAVEPPREKH